MAVPCVPRLPRLPQRREDEASVSGTHACLGILHAFLYLAALSQMECLGGLSRSRPGVLYIYIRPPETPVLGVQNKSFLKREAGGGAYPCGGYS